MKTNHESLGYILHTCEHGAYDANQGRIADMTEAQVKEHNARVEQEELALWATCPDSFSVYISKVPDEIARLSNRYKATTWNGTALSRFPFQVTSYRGNISRNMVCVSFVGTNGATYHGRYGPNWSQLCRVRKSKAKAPKTLKTTLQRVRLNSQGYDASGAYWGVGQKLYYYSIFVPGDGELSDHIRASNRVDAKAKIRALRPTLIFSFYN